MKNNFKNSLKTGKNGVSKLMCQVMVHILTVYINKALKNYNYWNINQRIYDYQLQNICPRYPSRRRIMNRFFSLEDNTRFHL